MEIDKFDYHFPLYRQHRRLVDSGIRVSRPWLTQLMQSTVALLEPIYDAQLESTRASRVKAMDEVPIKAGRALAESAMSGSLPGSRKRAWLTEQNSLNARDGSTRST